MGLNKRKEHLQQLKEMVAQFQTDAVEKARFATTEPPAQKGSPGSKTQFLGVSSQTKAENQESKTENNTI